MVCVQQKCAVCWLHITTLFTIGSNTLLDQQLLKVNIVTELEAGEGERGPWMGLRGPMSPLKLSGTMFNYGGEWLE